MRFYLSRYDLYVILVLNKVKRTNLSDQELTMLNYLYKDSLNVFLKKNPDEIFGQITKADLFDSIKNQKSAWAEQIQILKDCLFGLEGDIYFEFSIPRMGKRIDVLLIIKNIVFILEFKVGETQFLNYAKEQVWDYALDLKNFHEPSHNVILVPILVATEAVSPMFDVSEIKNENDIIGPLFVGKSGLKELIQKIVWSLEDSSFIDSIKFEQGTYSPTPTIIEAAISLYNNHSVEGITRNDAGIKNLTVTTEALSTIIKNAKSEHKKIICFVTGVPGAGKTLVGLKVATLHLDKEKGDSSVYLSGNAPLVTILQEALTRDKVDRAALIGLKIKKNDARQAVKSFIQIIHHYRDQYLVDLSSPYDHVAIFDEAQRAWNKEQTIKFMRDKKKKPDFNDSEPEFLISCLDRHEDWAVVICLVGGGQEINTGEAGISEWLRAIYHRFPHWGIYISPNLQDNEYSASSLIGQLENKNMVSYNADLHLAVSMRSFRAEHVSTFVQHLLDINIETAQTIFLSISKNYPIVLTRDLSNAKKWLKKKARGGERYGIVVSSQAQRLKPLAIDIRSPMNPVNWFLDGKDDVRSSFFLEDVATEFHVQGLELDWVCVTWDGDLRYSNEAWGTYSFKGNKWQNIKNLDRKQYLINAYRVLLTRARQGMVIVVPEGSAEDHTRNAAYYDGTYEYLSKGLGIPVLEINTPG